MYAGYIRVSTQEQRESRLSLDMQKDAILHVVQKEGLPFFDLIEDEAKSGIRDDRPGLMRLIHHIEQDRIKGVLVYRLDRLYRNIWHMGPFITLIQKKKVVLRSMTEDVDTTTGDGQMILTARMMVAQKEHSLISERNRDTNNRLYKLNRVRTVPPFGYQVDKNKQLIEDPREQKIISMITSLHNEGLSDYSIAQVLRKLGPKYRGRPNKENPEGRYVSRATIRKVCNAAQNRSYP